MVRLSPPGEPLGRVGPAVWSGGRALQAADRPVLPHVPRVPSRLPPAVPPDAPQQDEHEGEEGGEHYLARRRVARSTRPAWVLMSGPRPNSCARPMHGCTIVCASLRRACRPLRRPLRRRPSLEPLESLQRAARYLAFIQWRRDELRGLGPRARGRVHGDLEDVGPALARDEEAVALLVVRDAVEHVLTGGGTGVAGRGDGDETEMGGWWQGGGGWIGGRSQGDRREFAVAGRHLGSASRRRSAGLISPERSTKRCTAPLVGQITASRWSPHRLAHSSPRMNCSSLMRRSGTRPARTGRVRRSPKSRASST